MTGRLIIASNRTASPGEPKVGGLAVAIWEALSERGGGVWFGWSGETLERETRGVRLFAEDNVDFALADLTEAEYEGYYLGYANRALWPVFHYRVDLAHFDETEFATYEEVNRRFGRLLAQFTRPDDTVWVHDYHFLLMGQEMRTSGWEGPMGFFLHIPFPAPEIFTSLPQHRRIARALCAFDLIGFQTERDRANFERYLVEIDQASSSSDGTISVFGRTLRTKAFPIGIDADEIVNLANSEEGRSAASRLGRIIDQRALVLGVDRMDYSKGLPQRMHAFGRMLDENEHIRGRVSFLQIAPPSREDVDTYQDLRIELDQVTGRINGDHGDLDWVPIRYLARGYPRGMLSGLYRLARVGLVTPLYDGMNLVAKEFVAAQDPEDPGTLVLSEFAGAAEQLQGAIFVNPHDIAATADAIQQGINMPLEERIERWKSMDAAVRAQSIAWWRRAFLDELESLGKPAPDTEVES
ncbi:MAG: trehalose-6-phosphate synthase [Rhodobacteraceae bacterium]|nr:trehalose-6-phosphate synthase [Paracoccaceae bacterium]